MTTIPLQSCFYDNSPSLSLELLKVLFEPSQRDRPNATPDTDILVLIQAFDYDGYTDTWPRSPVAHRCRHRPPCAVIHIPQEKFTIYSKHYIFRKIHDEFIDLFNGMILSHPVRCVEVLSSATCVCVCSKYNPRVDGLLFFIFHFSFYTTDHNSSKFLCHSSNTMVATESRMRAWTLAVLSIALCATRLATASASIVALSEEKIQMSNAGNLRYESLSDDEKLLLFQQYISDCQRTVRDCDDDLEQYAQTM
jgi:hypothetical protein